MVDIAQFVKAFDASGLGLLTLFWLLIAFAITRVWPWFTGVWFIERNKREDKRLDAELQQQQKQVEIIDGIRAALVEIKTYMANSTKHMEATNEHLLRLDSRMDRVETQVGTLMHKEETP